MHLMSAVWHKTAITSDDFLLLIHFVHELGEDVWFEAGTAKYLGFYAGTKSASFTY